MSIINIYGVTIQGATPVYLSINLKKCQIWNCIPEVVKHYPWTSTMNVFKAHENWFKRKDVLIRVIE